MSYPLLLQLAAFVLGYTSGSTQARYYRNPTNTSIGYAGNPGIALHVTNDGFLYIKDIVQKALRRKLSDVHIAEVQNGTFLRIQFKLADFQVVHLSDADKVSAELRPQTPYQIRINVERFDISFKITILTSLRNLKYVVLLVSIERASFSESIQLTINEHNRKLKVSSSQCTFKVGPMSSDILEMDGRYGMANIVRNVFMKRLHLLMQENFCKRLSAFTDDSLDKIVQELPVRQPLIESGPSSSPVNRLGRMASQKTYNTSNSRNSDRVQRRADPLHNFYMDLGLVFNPKVVISPPIKYLLLPIRGEIAKPHSMEPPFKPKRIQNIPGKRGVMLYIVITDYPVNSMLYHMHQDGMFNYTFSSKDKGEMGKFLRPDCDDLMCIGFSVPLLESRFSNHEIVAKFFLTEPPVARFEPNGTVVTFSGQLELFAAKDGRIKSLFGYEVHVTVDPMTRLEDDRIRGKALIKNFSMRQRNVTEGQLKMLDGHGELFGSLMKVVIEEKLNEILNTGLSLPQSRILKLNNAEMMMAKNAVWLTADLLLDQEELESLLSTSGL